MTTEPATAPTRRPARPGAPLNERTVAMYEGYARNYALLIGPLPDPDRRAWLERLCRTVGPRPRVLEIGSGTGCDADYLDSLGARTRRTDATRSFVDLQVEHGHAAEVLDVLTDDLADDLGPGDEYGGYDAVVAMCVLIHVDRPLVPAVLAKVRSALRPGGAFLVSVREGCGDELSPTCFTSQWLPGEFDRRMTDAAFVVEATGRYVDRDGDVWRTLLGRREPTTR